MEESNSSGQYLRRVFQSDDVRTCLPILCSFPLKLVESIELARLKGNYNSERAKGAVGIREKGGCAHLRQFADEVVSVRFLRGFDHLILGNAVISVADILPYRRIKEHWLLTDHADVRAQPLNIQCRHVEPI